VTAGFTGRSHRIRIVDCLDSARQSKQQIGAIQLGTSAETATTRFSNATNHTITCCGETLGALVTRGGMQYILGNNHVLARRDTAAVGDPIVRLD